VHDLVETLLEGRTAVFMHEEFTSLGCNNVLPNPLDHSHASPLCSLPSPSSKYYIYMPIDYHMICDANVDLDCEDNVFGVLSGSVDNFVSLGYLRGYDPSIDLYCLGDLPKKTMWYSLQSL